MARKFNVINWLRDMEVMFPKAFGKLLEFECTEVGMFDTLYLFFKSEGMDIRFGTDITKYEDCFKELENR